jgi:hypothetical protein
MSNISKPRFSRSSIMKKISLVFSIVLSSFISYSQVGNIYELMERTDLSIEETQRIAQRHFDSVGTGRGTGYKQFQRWLYERKFHIDENGNFISTKTDWQHYQENLPSLTAGRTEAGNWTELGPFNWNRTSGWNPGVGRLSALAVSSTNANLIYAGSPGGGIWRTTNGGTNWTPLSDNNSTWMSVFALAIDPINNGRVYAGFSGNNGIVISTDGGNSWTASGAGPSGTVRKILIHPTSTNIVYAACTNGIWRSTNSGSSWTQVHSGGKEDIEFKPDNTNIMYATGNDVFRSIDGGLSWTNVGTAEGITNTGRTLVAVSPANPNYVYICQASGSSFGRMYKSTDAGLSFTTTVVGNTSAGTNYFGYETNGTGTGGQATYDMALDVNPTNASEVYIAGIICWKSADEAATFTAITAWSLPNTVGYNHADVHGLFWVGSILYSISDGGVYKSLNNGDDWIDITAGMGIRQFYRIATSPTNPNVVTGGAQDNGSSTIQAGGAWVDWLGADGMEGLVSPTNHLNIWGTSQNGALYRSTNGGNSRTNLTQPSSGQWVTPLAIHPTNETTLYGGWTGVYKSTNSGTSWTNISSGTISTTLAELAVAPSDPNYIYASTGATLWVTTDDGATWATRTAPATINDIAIDANDPNKIWVALNSTSNKIMVSTNAGASFTNISSNLPNIVARTVVVDDNTPRRLYVGLNIGVYEKLEADANWTDVSANLPKVAINELDIHKIDGTLKVATYGRGVWEMPLTVPSGFSFGTTTATTTTCPAPANLNVVLPVNSIGGFNNPVTLTVQSTAPAGLNVTVTSPVTPGNNAAVTLNNANTLAPGTYTASILGTASSASNQTATVTFTINSGTGPAITGQPAPQNVCVGSNATFSITAIGTYQWQISTDGGASWNNISGATVATLNLTAVTTGMNNNQYRCIVTGQCGSTTSNSATLTVNTTTTITAQPADASICAGQQTTLCVTVNGTNITYQWQSATSCSGGWTNVSGATNNCLTITPATTTSYRCVVTATGACGATINSSCATVTVVSSVAITTQPANQTVCEGAAAIFTAAGSGSGLTYQWQISAGGGPFTNIAGATNAIYNTGATTAGMSGNQYRCIISNGICPTPGTTNAAVLTVNTLPAISSSPQNATLCVGSNNTFSVTATGTGINYQWQLSIDGGVSYNNISGANNSSYTVNSITTSMNGYRYRCLITGTCAPPATSGAAILTVITPVNIVTQPVNAEICSGGNSSFVVVTNQSAVLFQWQVSIDGGNNWTNINGATVPMLNLTNVASILNGNRYRVLLSNTTCTNPTISTAVLLTVRTTPTIGLAASLTTLLPGQTSLLTANPSTTTGGTLNTSWTYNNNPLSVTGNTYTANVEQVGIYQAKIQESWVSGLICSAVSQTITINASTSNRLFIFPTPNDGNFTVSYYNDGGASTTRILTIFDSKGALVYNRSFNIGGAYTLLPVNMQNANRGIYYVVISNAAGNRLAEGKVHVR